jgi:histidinol-phosphate aminotransferase
VAQAAAAEALRHGDDVARRVEQTVAERVFVEEGLRELGLETPDSHANFSWVDQGDRDEGELVGALAEAGIVVRAGTPLGGPGHIRVTYGSHQENERFLEALAEAV